MVRLVLSEVQFLFGYQQSSTTSQRNQVRFVKFNFLLISLSRFISCVYRQVSYFICYLILAESDFRCVVTGSTCHLRKIYFLRPLNNSTLSKQCG